jgi:proline dehydrogenase
VSATAAVNAGVRKAILAAADSARVGRFVRRHGMRLGAARFVAGETFADAIPVLRGLNERGLRANTTLLGEGVRDRAETERVVDAYTKVLDGIAEHELRCNVALKLTHLGLDIDEELAYENVARLVAYARERSNFVRIDMEQSSYVDATLRVYRRLREAGHDNVGTVLQAYLYRTERDLEDLLPLGPNLRLVKGAYLEPPELAYPAKADVDAAYARLLERMLSDAAFTAVATHDESLIDRAIAYAERNGVARDRFQLQMLFGVRPQLQLDLAGRGFDVLVATPFGPEWYPYLMRRLGERPANLGFFLRNAVRR